MVKYKAKDGGGEVKITRNYGKQVRWGCYTTTIYGKHIKTSYVPLQSTCCHKILHFYSLFC